MRVKKYLCLFVVILFPVLLFGCRGEKEKGREIETLKDYYPFHENLKKVYEGVGSELSNYVTFIEYTEENKAQIKVFNPATVMVKVVEYENGQLRETYRQEEFYHIEHKLQAHNILDNLLLKEPLKVGNSWSTPDRYKRTITGIDVDITTPYKKFKAIEVTTEYGENRRQLDYYVKDIGHVATIYIDGDMEIKSLLKDMAREPYKFNMKFYYPTLDMEVVYVERQVDFNTNWDIKNIFETYMKKPEYTGLLPLLEEGVKINSITYDKADGLIRIDFSKGLLSSMEREGFNEILGLKSIVNTIGSYYNVKKVYLSVEGKPYSSKLFTLEEDEFFNVDYTHTKEYQKN